MTDTLRVAPPSGSRTGPFTFLGRPVWIISGQIGIGTVLMLGFGAVPSQKPKLYMGLMLLCAISVVVLGPKDRLRHVVISLPVLLLLTWWVASYGWTSNRLGWQSESKTALPVLLSMTVIASLLPIGAIKRGLVNSCYLAIGYTCLYIALHPATATVHPDGVPGWHGAFIHKNVMAPFMALAICALLAFDRPRRLRTITITVALFLIVMSQSTTTLAVGVILIPVGVVLAKLAASDERSSRVILLFVSAGSAAIGTLGVFLLPELLRSQGKDLTLSSRTQIWSGVWRAIQHRPWVGYGVGGVWINPTSEPTRDILRHLGFIVVHSHNGYLEMMLELGIVGLVLYVCLIVAFMYNAVVLLRSDMQLGRFMVLLAMIVLLVSISEVATFGPWLGMLAMFNVVALRVMHRSNDARRWVY